MAPAAGSCIPAALGRAEAPGSRPEVSDMWAVNWQLGLSSHLAVDMWILLGVSILFHLFVSFYYYYFTRKLRGESVTVRNVPAIGSLPKWPQQ